MSVYTLSLVSNSSMSLFPDNTSSHFVCKFPEQLYYNDGEYEMAMTSFQCRKSWYTFREDEEYSIKFFVAHGDYDELEIKNGVNTMVELANFSLKSGVYESGHVLQEEINNKIIEKGLHGYYDFEYDDITKKMKLSFTDTDNRWYKVHMSDDLARKLGFINFPSEHNWVSVYGKPGKMIEGGFTVRIDEIDQIFVACDLVQNNHVVGDIKSPLLHIVPSSGSFDSVINFEPSTLLWLPIKRKTFDMAEVYITDAQGRNIPFSSGTSVVRVDIRRKNLFK